MNLQSLLGNLAFGVTWLLRRTLRVRVENHVNYNANQQYLFAFWHGKQLMPILEFYRHQTGRAALVSSSKDGEILSTWLNQLGYEVVRGSSRRNNVSALAGMLRKLKQGFSIGFGVDGPIGPIYQVKPGMTHMAQKLGIEIVVVGTAIQNKWIFKKAWDRFEVPKPFSKVVCYVGEPIRIQLLDNLEECNRILEQKIQQAERMAEKLLIT